MAKASRLPSGSWRVIANLGKDPLTGKQIRQSVTAPTKKEAEYKALQLTLRYKAANSGSESMLLRDAFDRYIKSKEGVLSVTTIVNYRSITRCYFQSLMDVRLSKLSRNHIQIAVSEEAKLHSPKTVRNAYGLLSATLGEYHRQLYRDLKDDPIRLPQKQKYHPNVLTVEQVAVLLRAVQGTAIEIPVLCGIWLCMRESEIVGLKWDCIDFAQGILHVKAALVLSGRSMETLKSTKTTESDRWLSLHPYLLERLRAAHSASESEFVVDMTAHNVYRRFKTVLRKNNLPDIRFHDLRHSNASIMALLGVPQYLAQLRGGWSTPDTMQRIYTHQMQTSNDGDRLVNEFFSGLLQLEE